MHSPVNRAGATGALGQNSTIDSNTVGKTTKGRKVSTVTRGGNPKDSAALRKPNPNIPSQSKPLNSRKITNPPDNNGSTKATIKTSHKTISSSVKGLKQGVGLDTNVESFQLARRDVAIGAMRLIRELTSRVQGGNAKLKAMGFEKGSPADEAMNRVINSNSPNPNDIEQIVRTMADNSDSVVDTLNYLVNEGNGKKGLVASEELKPLLEESATPGIKSIESLITDCVDSFKDSGFSEALEERVAANEQGVQEHGSRIDGLEAAKETLGKAIGDVSNTVEAVGLTAKNNEQAIKDLEKKTSQDLETMESRQKNTLDEKLAQARGDTDQKLNEAGKEVDRKLAEASKETDQKLTKASEDTEKKLAEVSKETDQKLTRASEDTEKKLAEVSKETDQKLARVSEDMEKKLARAEQHQAEKVSDLEHQVVQLSNDHLETKQKAEDNSTAIETLQTELGNIQALNGDITEVLNRFDTADKEIKTANATAKDARKLAGDAKALAGDAAEKAVNAEQLATQANTTALDVKDLAETQEKRLNQQQQEIQSLKTAREQEQQTFEVRFKVFEEGLAAMNRELTTTKEKLASLEGQLEAGKSESGANTNDVDLLRKELLTHVQGLQQNVDLESQRAKTAEEALAHQIRNFDEQIHGHEERIDRITQEQEKLGENQERLESKSKNLETAAQRLEDTIKNGEVLKDEKVTKLEETVQKLESALGGVNTEKNHHDNTVKKMVEEIELLNQEIKELREQIGELKGKKPAVKPELSESHTSSQIQKDMESTASQKTTASLKELVAKEHRFGLLSEAKISLDMLLSKPPETPPDEPVVNIVVDGKKIQISPLPEGKTLDAWVRENKKNLTIARSMIEGEQTVMKSSESSASASTLPSDTYFKAMLQTKIQKEEDELNTGSKKDTWLTEIEDFRKKLEKQLTIDFKKPTAEKRM